jgi:hypothetical protein
MAIETRGLKLHMKTKVIVAGLVTLAAAAATYFILKKRNKKENEPLKKSHHVTDVFSKAKEYATQ